MIPLCIDLDGTLIHEDTVKLACAALFKKSPIKMGLASVYLLKGLAAFKKKVMASVELDPESFTYHPALLNWLKAEKAQGRKLFLVSATDQKVASAVGKHLNLFDDVMASNGQINLRAKNKRNFLDQRFGKGQYDYAGNDTPDLAVWAHAHAAIVVRPTQANLLKRCQKISAVERVFD